MIFALVMALLWLWGIGSLLAIVFGVIAARECDRTNSPGHGLATFAALLGLVGLLATPIVLASSG